MVPGDEEKWFSKGKLPSQREVGVVKGRGSVKGSIRSQRGTKRGTKLVTKGYMGVPGDATATGTPKLMMVSRTYRKLIKYSF